MADDFNFKFSSYYTDDETGLVYYGFRYYDADMGRWLSRDPIAESGGVNIYGFVLNNPVSYWDLLGLVSRTNRQYKDNDNIFVIVKKGWSSVKFKSDSGKEGCWTVEGDGSGPSVEIDGSSFGKTVKIKPIQISAESMDSNIIFNKGARGGKRAKEENIWISVRRPKYIKLKNLKRIGNAKKMGRQVIGYQFRYYFYDQFNDAIPAGIPVSEEIDNLEGRDVDVQDSALVTGNAATQAGGWVQDTWTSQFTYATLNGADAAGQILTIGDYNGVIVNTIKWNYMKGAGFQSAKKATMR